MDRLTKKQNIFVRHRFALLFFAFMALWQLVIVNHLQIWRVNDVTFSTLCLDYSFGFASKILPGAIFHLFFGPDATRAEADAFASAVLLVIYALTAVLLEKFMLRVPEGQRASALTLCAVLLTGAYTFSFYSKWAGIIDTWWLVFTLLFLVLLEHRRLRFLIPLIYAASLLIHFSALVFFITFYSILLVYRIGATEDRRERAELWAVFAVSLALTAGLFFYLILNESRLILPADEFRQKLSDRGCDNQFYINYAFFRVWGDYSFAPEGLSESAPTLMKFLRLFGSQLELCLWLYKQDPVTGVIVNVGGLALLAPPLLFILRFHRRRFRETKSPLRRFGIFLMLVQIPYGLFMELLFASAVDMTRYLTYTFLPALVCLMTVLYREEEARAAFFEEMRSYRRFLPLKLWFLAYALISLDPSL